MNTHADHNDCPIAKTATLLSDVWTMLIVRDLLRAPKRFNELHQSLKGISTRTLTNKLKRLEELDLVSKDDVRYSLTPAGKKMKSVIEEMEKYGKKLD